ncbi:MAG: hypothetical protein ACHQ2Z_00670 [Elusimicrobiota bacterium]
MRPKSSYFVISPWAAAALVAAACVLYAAAYARLWNHSALCDVDAEAAVAAGDWLWRHKPMLREVSVEHGPGDLWLTVPFLALFGEGRTALFLRNGAFGVLGVIACAALAYEFEAGTLGAAAAALFLALTPSWARNSVEGVFTCIASCALAPLSLALWLRSARERRPSLALASALALGVALSARSTMLGWTLGMAAAAAAGALPSPWAGISAFRRRAGAGACAALFLLPQAPLALHVLLSPDFRRSWAAKLFHPAPGHYALAGDMVVRLRQLWVLFAAPDSYIAVLLAGAAALAALAARGKRFRRDDLPWILAACYVVLSLLRPSGLGNYHLLPLVPLLAAAVCALPAKAGRRRLAFSVLAVLLVWRAATFARDSRDPFLNGESHCREATLELYAYFAARPGSRPIFLGDFMVPVFELVSKGAIRPLNVAPQMPEAEASAAWNAAFEARESLFVVSARYTTMELAKRFRAEASGRRLKARLEREFTADDGSITYQVFRVERREPRARGG